MQGVLDQRPRSPLSAANEAEAPNLPEVAASPLFRVLAAIANAVTPAEVFEALVDRVAEVVGASSVALWLVGDEDAGITLARSRGYSEKAAQVLSVLSLDGGLSMPVLDCIRSATPIWIDSQPEVYRRYPHLRPLAMGERSYRLCCLPLVAEGRVLASLCLTIESEGRSSEGEKEFLLLVARYATQAIERIRLYEAERRSRARADEAAARLRLLNRVTAAFAEADLELMSRLKIVAAELSQTLDSCINIGLVEEDGLLHLIALHHPIPEANEELQGLAGSAPVPLGEGATGTIGATGESLIHRSLDPATVAATAAPAYRDFLARYPAYAFIGTALRVDGRVIGTVTATRTRRGESYADDDLQLLEALATRAAVAIENSRLYQETLDARTRAEQLYRFAQAVAVADRVEVVYDVALDCIEAALGVGRSAILTFDEQRVMRFRAWRCLSDGYRAAVEGHSPWAPDASNPEPVVVPDAAADPALTALAEVLQRERVGALAFIPLATHGRLLGKFMLYYEGPHTFTRAELETARAIANHLASVIARFSALASLEETIRYNELFAGVLAHDLRTPLSAILNAAQLLLLRQEGQTHAQASQARPLGKIIASGMRMGNMITQLLDFTKARSGGGIQLDLREIDLGNVAAHAIGELELAQPEWTVRCEMAGDMKGIWDHDRLVQVLSNLIANAGQHGRKGEPVTTKLDGQRADEVLVEVHNGGAVSPSVLPTLFDPFRTTRHHRGQSSGLGLGLFIVREIVKAHGGSVSLDSSEAAGTTVTLRLPRRAQRDRLPAAVVL